MNKEYHVSVTGNDTFDGTLEKPFRTISQAARIAETGSTVIVHAGEYREWVKPEHSGYSDLDRIVYTAAPGEKVVIKGSERIDNWENIGGTVWKVTLPNTFFGDYNPYKETLNGDWLLYPDTYALHTGDVYLNGKSFYEAPSLEAVKNPEKRIEGMNPPWTRHTELLLEPEQSVYQWYAQVTDCDTTIYANFQGADPNKELTEINVRKCCFYPERTGLNYITVRGFEMAQAACPWAPPTADQPGLIGPHWAKGWIIENNRIHDAKCSGISIGKEISTGHNLCTRRHRKPGYQYQMEAVFRAYNAGWSKETIGSHIIRNNEIYDCGQNAIVGHLGCIFSEIYNNHIYNIAVKHEYFGYEIAGIKLHAAIDVQIHHNNIHNCTLGAWMDWQAQGTRISCNLFYRNDRDLMVEVSHGPYIVDNNVFASEYNFDNISQGGAYIHNLCCGTMRRESVLDRATPYHMPHSTKMLGTALIFAGDDRIYQNIFIGARTVYTPQSKSGTAGYGESTLPEYLSHLQGFVAPTAENADCPGSYDEYISRIIAAGPGDHDVFMRVTQAAYINGNCYYRDARPFPKEQDTILSPADPEVKIITEDNKTYLEFTVDDALFARKTEVITTEKLGTVRIADACFDAPDGAALVFDTDYTGAKRCSRPLAGPFENLKPGRNRILVWSC